MTSTTDNSQEITNGFRLMRLIIEGGSKALRITLRNQTAGNTLLNVLNDPINSSILTNLKNRKILKQNQWDLLYPGPLGAPNDNDFDITLLCLLLSNVCGLKPSNDPVWKTAPIHSNHSTEADVTRIRLFRNKYLGHASDIAIGIDELENLWFEVSRPLVRLGLGESEIDRLKYQSCGTKDVLKVLDEINVVKENLESMNANVERVKEDFYQVSANFESMKEDVHDINMNFKTLMTQIHEGSDDDVLSKKLVMCNFSCEIEHHYGKFIEHTREWVFDKFMAWFHDNTSEKRAFVISALAGMGKSVIAAVLCKRFPKYIAAVHFFQYNNSQYNKANVVLQSLALQLSRAFPSYKKRLLRKLSGNLSQPLNSMNVEGLFSILFKEPLSEIFEIPTPMLVLLDAVDECGSLERPHLANLIAYHLHKLPAYLRFVITTRPEENLLYKFENLNPLFIKCCDERNLRDVKFIIQERIRDNATISQGLLNDLANKSEGVMLFACLLCERHNENPESFDINKLPKVLEEHYEAYLKRLGKELDSLGVSEDKFHFFLTVLAVAKEPLPQDVFNAAFCLNSKAKLNKIRKVLSSLFVTNAKGSVSFFHKSLSDWLTDSLYHDYSVDVIEGHNFLFLCSCQTMDMLKSSGVYSDAIEQASVRYSLKFWLHHMLELPDYDHSFYVSKYLVDLEVLFALVLIDVDVALSNIMILISHDIYFNLPQDIRATVTTMYCLIKRNQYMLEKIPKAFLQTVASEFRCLSSKATSLLRSRFMDIAYLELRENEKSTTGFESQFFFSGGILSLDVSPDHRYVVCCNSNSEVELFSLKTEETLWIRKDFICKAEKVSVVFHPFESLIFAGRLDLVIMMDGKTSLGPFDCSGCISVLYTKCCYSKDKTIMVTYYEKSITIWDVNSGKKDRILECESLISFSFTLSGLYFGTIDDNKMLRVYDVVNSYKVIEFEGPTTSDGVPPDYILSTLGQHSWCCKAHHILLIVNPTGENLSDLHFYNIYNTIVPVDPFCSILSGRSWFARVKPALGRCICSYFYLSDQKLLIFRYRYSQMNLVSLKTLKDFREPDDLQDCNVFSNRNGDIYYINNIENASLVIHNVNTKNTVVNSGVFNVQVVVRTGVILLTNGGNVQLWNKDMTLCVNNFDQLKGIERVLKVSEDLIACQLRTSVVFFNVYSQQIESQTDFNEVLYKVHACSAKYHVLAKTKTELLSLRQHGTNVVCLDAVLGNQIGSRGFYIPAAFSPKADKLAISGNRINPFPSLLIIDVYKIRVLSAISLFDFIPPDEIFFLDGRFLISKMLYNLQLVDTEHSEISSYVHHDVVLNGFAICNQRNAIFCTNRFGEIVTINFHLPRDKCMTR